MLKNLTRTRAPAIKWESVKNKILSRDYELELILVGDRFMSELNRKYRRKTGPTNILSFALSRLSGQIFIDIPFSRRESKKLGAPLKRHILYLYIHGLLHLKGFDHKNGKEADIMKKEESKWLKTLS
ncbi:MAG: rRNA maturation RNase YbeY [Candidatus Niyogibacteria bacterium]|nr:rRNA maturation RNase YbeY [Candidatus Niyogibacteria bacterium]